MLSKIKNVICSFFGISVKTAEQTAVTMVEDVASKTVAVIETVGNTVETVVDKIEDMPTKKRQRKTSTGEIKQPKPRAPRKNKKTDSKAD